MDTLGTNEILLFAPCRPGALTTYKKNTRIGTRPRTVPLLGIIPEKRFPLQVKNDNE